MTAETILSNDKHNEFVASKDTDYFQNVAESILEYALEHPGVFKPEFDERFSEENFEENEEDFDNFRDPIIERIYSLDSLFTELSAVLPCLSRKSAWRPWPGGCIACRVRSA